MPRHIAIDQRTSVSPEVITERLKKETRWSLIAFQGSPLTLGSKPLKGVIKKDAFTIGLNHRDLLQMLQPTARMKLEKQADGSTRVHGEVGIPAAMIWFLRGITGLVAPAAVVAAMVGAFSSSWMLALGVGALMAVGLIIGTGISINNAEGQLETLARKVEDIISVSGPSSTSTTEASRDAHRAAQQASTRLKQ